MNHKWEYDKNGLDRKCAKCGARSHKNLIREKAWGMPYLKGEPKLECGQPNSPDQEAGNNKGARYANTRNVKERYVSNLQA